MFGLLHKISMLVTECDSCQRTNHSIKAPQPIPITGLWNLWGVDLIGSLTFTPHGRNRYIIVATDYFLKWPEAAPLQRTLSSSEFIDEVTFN